MDPKDDAPYIQRIILTREQFDSVVESAKDEGRHEVAGPVTLMFTWMGLGALSGFVIGLLIGVAFS